MAKRKENGTGTFRKKGSKWNYQFSYKEPGSQERKLKSFTAETEEECLIRAEKFLAELTDGAEHIRADITIPDIMREKYDNDFGMSDDELLYREMNPEDPWYMGPSEDNILYDSDEIDVDDLADWD